MDAEVVVVLTKTTGFGIWNTELFTISKLIKQKM